MEETNLKVFETRPVLGNGYRNEDVQHPPRLQTGSSQIKFVAKLLGIALMVAIVVNVVLLIVLVTGKVGNDDCITIRSSIETQRKGAELLNFTSCGIYLSNRVFNGDETALSAYPWMALLLDLNGNVFCGGTLISERYVLTAAHCVNSEHTLTVRLGEHNTSSPIDCEDIYGENCAPLVQDFNVTKKDIIEHEFYSPKMRSNDIALIRLPRPANMADNRVLPICLPHGDFKDFKEVEPGTNMTIAGWGQTKGGTTSNVLMHAKVTVKSSRSCTHEYNYNNTNSKTTFDDRNLYAVGERGQNHCVGDSGGPMQFFKYALIDKVNRTVAVQLGIITLGDKNCTSESLSGVYLKVSYYMDWILINMTE